MPGNSETRGVIERNLSERYRLETRIGQGGMAIVYSGTDTVLRRRVAIKVLREQLAADEDFVDRFYTEAHHAAKLSHPNIVNIYDVGREGENYFIVMELVDGATLGEMMERGRALPEAVAIDFAAQLCNGLAYAHRQGLLHRDVKPANVLVTKDDVVKLSDFGIARAVTTQTMTQAGMVMGSVYYISPEQAQGLEIGPASDLYSLGVVLYQMLVGALPFTGDSPVTVALKHVSQLPPEIDTEDGKTSPALAAIVRKLLQKDPADRFASASEVAKALREARERPLSATPFDVPQHRDAPRPSSGPRTIPSPKPRPSKFPDRPNVAAAAVEDLAEDEDVPARRRGPGFMPIAMVAALVLGIAIAAGYVLSNHSAGLFAPAIVRVPGFVGDTLDDAEKKLTSMGIHYNVISTTSDTVPANKIVRQDPVPSTEIGSGTIVQLYASSGLPSVTLLDLKQYSVDDAQRYLHNARLVPKIEETYNDAPHGTVIGQRPDASTAIAERSTVVLIVSKGPHPVAVPDVVSMTVDDATKAIQGRKLHLVVTERDPSDEIPANVVTSQSPQAGAEIDPNGSVNVVISSGPEKLTLPDVNGKMVADAQSALSDVGLTPVIEYAVDPNTPQGTVMKQSPDANAAALKGDKVTLLVAVPGIVPDVSGKSVPDATTIMHDAGYKVGNTAYVQEGPDGTVARTEPAAGTQLRPGETVTLYVSGTSP
jgi:serine/threonine-protein kinase